MSFLKVLQILWVMWYIQWTQKSYHVCSGCLEEIENNGKILKLSRHELTRGGQLLLSSWDLTHASLSSSEQWFTYFIHVDNETRVYIYYINFCQTIMVPFTVCLLLIIFRWKYMWQTTLLNFASQGVVGFVSSFLCTGQVRASNISRGRGAAKFRLILEIPRNSQKCEKYREIW